MFYTNFTLAQESGYFDVSINVKPLMHLWSLSIEEQFYILWPLALYYVNKKGFNMHFFCIGVVILSFLIGIKTLNKNTVQAFYFPWCRFWELISGALLASVSYSKITIVDKAKSAINDCLNLIVYNDSDRYSSKTVNNVASFIGFAAIMYSIICFKSSYTFPGWNAILPVLGTLLILSAGQNAYINRKILSNKLLVSIGLISYPLYLWHWSLLSFAFILEGQHPSYKIILIILLVSFVLSFMIYRFIERPIRLAKNNKFIVTILIVCLVLVGMFAFLIVINKGYSFRYANLINNMLLVPESDEKFLDLYVSCYPPFKKRSKQDNSSEYCIANSAKPKFLVAGDSHALSFMYANNIDYVGAFLGGQPAFLNYFTYQHEIYHSKKARISEFNLYRKSIENLIKNYSSIDYVILVSRGPIYISGKGFGIEEKNILLNNWKLERVDENKPVVSSQEAFVEGYVEMIEFLLSKGKKVIFAIDYPELGIDPTTCLKRPFYLSNKERSDCLLGRNVVDERQKEYRDLVTKIQLRVPSIIVYDPYEIFCNQAKCDGKKGDTILYGDDDHLNLEGCKLLMHHFKSWLLEQGLLTN